MGLINNLRKLSKGSVATLVVPEPIYSDDEGNVKPVVLPSGEISAYYLDKLDKQGILQSEIDTSSFTHQTRNASSDYIEQEVLKLENSK